MPRKLVLDCSEANYTAAAFHISAAILALCALTSNDWIYVNPGSVNSTLAIEDATLDIMFEHSGHTEKCQKIGCFDFWNPVSFGGFFDAHQKTHIVFRSKARVLIDCVTPVVANIFYVIIALCFVLTMTAIVSATIAICTPPNPFLQWLRRNTIPEMCNMIITLFCCTMALMAQSEVAAQRPDDDEVNLGSGVIMISFCGLFSFAAAASHIRHTTRLNRLRRMDNQRIMCSRSLRSWRDAARRREDTLPIVDFERYIDPPTAMDEISTVTATPSSVPFTTAFPGLHEKKGC